MIKILSINILLKLQPGLEATTELDVVQIYIRTGYFFPNTELSGGKKPVFLLENSDYFFFLLSYKSLISLKYA